MITDGAGVIRPTFYKHFQDKYGILEYILQKEIREKIDVHIENQLENDIFLLLCSCLSKDRAFYKKLYLIEGPNSFEEQMFQFIYELIFFLFNKYPLKAPSRLKILTKESLARFYTFGLADSIKYTITHDVAYEPKELAEVYDYLIHNSVLDLVEYPAQGNLRTYIADKNPYMLFFLLKNCKGFILSLSSRDQSIVAIRIILLV